MKILAISGSLRAASINSALLRTAARLAPSDIEVTLYAAIGELPLFNPDLELQVPPSIARLRAAVAEADALLIASPEYAHGVTGAIKNTLDWLVSFEPFVNKPVAVLNASPRAHHADLALRETLTTMSAVIIEAASVSIPLLGTNITESNMAEVPPIAGAIRESLAALGRAVNSQHPENGSALPTRDDNQISFVRRSGRDAHVESASSPSASTAPPSTPAPVPKAALTLIETSAALPI